MPGGRVGGKSHDGRGNIGREREEEGGEKAADGRLKGGAKSGGKARDRIMKRERGEGDEKGG